MKFRTDFVTNSSSSSFMLTVSIQLKNKKYLNWELNAYEDYYGDPGCYGEIDANLSPKRLAKCPTVDAMLDLLGQSVKLEGGDSVAKGKRTRFFNSVKKKIQSMDEIAQIRVEGIEIYSDNNCYQSTYYYDRLQDRYIHIASGEYQDDLDGAHGGYLSVPDEEELDRSFLDEDDLDGDEDESDL